MILCDGHVHIHNRDPLDAVLTSAVGNLQTIASTLEVGMEKVRYVLWLTESAGTDQFTAIWKDASYQRAHEWRFKPADEKEALIAEHPRGDQLMLIAGRQIVCRENIEILALGTREQIPDGVPLNATLDRILSVDALPVLPWGFGKWFGSRGETIHRLVSAQEEGKTTIFLGDICGRPTFPGLGSPFELAALRGIRVIAGSDPLPIPSGYAKIGRYGIAVEETTRNEPLPSRLKAMLKDPDTRVTTVGDRLPLTGFIREQILLRLHGPGRRRHSFV